MNKDQKRLNEVKGIPAFHECISEEGNGRTAGIPEVIQMNVGNKCNLTCKHCHIKAGPDRDDMMSREVMEACMKVCRKLRIHTVDITGGAPEMNENFRWLVEAAGKVCDHVIVRTNLVIMTEVGYRDLPEFYRDHRVEVVCSLPYYKAGDMERQRGKGTFSPAIDVLKKLNSVGYGSDPALVLNMVYNPGGAFLPPCQEDMEKEYKYRLWNDYGIMFNHLFTLTNNPVGRFGDFLERSGNLAGYMERLCQSFNEAVVPGMMCRYQVSVGWDGRLYDCDFNQAVNLPIVTRETIFDWVEKAYQDRQIVFGRHCFACTAGGGSSCGGSLE